MGIELQRLAPFFVGDTVWLLNAEGPAMQVMRERYYQPKYSKEMVCILACEFETEEGEWRLGHFDPTTLTHLDPALEKRRPNGK